MCQSWRAKEPHSKCIAIYNEAEKWRGSKTWWNLEIHLNRENAVNDIKTAIRSRNVRLSMGLTHKLMFVYIYRRWYWRIVLLLSIDWLVNEHKSTYCTCEYTKQQQKIVSSFHHTLKTVLFLWFYRCCCCCCCHRPPSQIDYDTRRTQGKKMWKHC